MSGLNDLVLIFLKENEELRREVKVWKDECERLYSKREIID